MRKIRSTRSMLSTLAFAATLSAANVALAYDLAFVSDVYEKCYRDPRPTDPAYKVAQFLGSAGLNAILATEVNNCNGTVNDYNDRINDIWAPLRSITHAVPGNHDYISNAVGFKSYFGNSTYHSFSTNVNGVNWRFIGIDSNIINDSTQRNWLDTQLDGEQCSIVYFHHPRWSSGQHGSNASMDALWKMLADHKVELALSGHDHNYERFWPLDRNGNRTNSGGVTQVVAGTGGVAIRDAGSPIANSIEIYDGSSDHGVLLIHLYDTGPYYLVGYTSPEGTLKSYWWGTCTW